MLRKCDESVDWLDGGCANLYTVLHTTTKEAQ